MSRPIDKIAKHDRPREKLIAKGPTVLSDQELLAVLLGKGTHQVDVMALAGKLAKTIDSRGLEVGIKDLTALQGIGDAKAALILAALEFARRRIKPEGLKISASSEVLPLIRHFADRKQEHFLSVTVNGANEVLNVRVVSVGLIDRSLVHPREVFADVMADRASGIIVAHNHPEGSLEPSEADIQVTQQIKQAGEIIGIFLLDHIIFNKKGYYSMLEHRSL